MPDVTFAVRLKFLRISIKKTQAEMSEIIGTSTKFYQRLEYGRNPPSERILEKLSKIFNVTVEYLIGTAVESEASEPSVENFSGEEKIHTADNTARFLFCMSDGFICTAKSCEWRVRIGANIYYCPGRGCLKVKRGEKLNAQET